MKPIVFAVAFLLVSLPAAAQQDPRIAEGTALHDAGRYDEAVAKYRAVLADNPANFLAAYELGFTYATKGDYANCRAVLEPFAGRPTPLQPRIFEQLGSCLDMAGEPKKAIAAYRKGLALAPNDPSLLYNLGVTYSGQKEFAKAADALKQDVIARPAHASGRYALARAFDQQGFRAAALVEFLRFLTLDSQSERAKEVAARVLELIEGSATSKDGGKNVNVMVDPNPRGDVGDSKTWGIMLSLASASRFTEGHEKKSAFQLAQEEVLTALTMLVESRGDSTGYTATHNLAFFAALQEKQLADVFAGVAVSSLGLEGTDAWVQANDKQIAALRSFLGSASR